MAETEVITNNNIQIEKRLTKLETDHLYVSDDIKEIKRNVRWILGVIVSSHTTIIGAIAKGLGYI